MQCGKMEIRLKSVQLKLIVLSFFDTTAIILLFKHFLYDKGPVRSQNIPNCCFLCTGKELHIDLFHRCQLYARLQAACINDLSPNSKKKERKMNERSGYFFSLSSSLPNSSKQKVQHAPLIKHPIVCHINIHWFHWIVFRPA